MRIEYELDQWEWQGSRRGAIRRAVYALTRAYPETPSCKILTEVGDDEERKHEG